MDDRPIVLGVDFSESSQVALQETIGLALDWRVPVVVAHAFEPMPLPLASSDLYLPGNTSTLEIMEIEEARRVSTEWAQQLRDEGIQVDVVVEESDPAALILKTAYEHNARLVVVGTQGRSALERFFLGSVATRIIRKAKVPTLVVPKV